MTPLYIPSQAWFWLVIGTGLFLIAVFSLDIWKDEIDKKREAEYDKLYAEIHHDLYNLPVTSENYDKIQSKLVNLLKLKWKNKEMTNLLDQNFKLIYLDERNKRNKEWLSRVIDRPYKESNIKWSSYGWNTRQL
jgi:hypothetical protein